MRIALVCPYDLDVPGGVQGQVLGLADALRRAGHVVLVLAPGAPHERADAAASGVLRVGASVAVAANGSRAPIALSPLAPVRARRAVRAFRADVLHLHEPFAPLLCLGLLSGSRAAIVATFHRAGAGPGYRALAPALAPLGRRIAVMVAVSDAASETATAVLRSDVAIDRIPNGVDTGRFASAVANSGRSGLVFVGRHEERKGLEVLLEAFGGLETEEELAVIGSGPRTGALVERYGADRRVRFLGRLDDAAVAAALGRAAVLVAPSLEGESFGIVLLEAMAAGAAVVASDLAGYREAGGDAVRFVAPGAVGPLRGAIAELLAAPSERAELAARGLARVEAFDFAAIAARYEDVYATARSRVAAR